MRSALSLIAALLFASCRSVPDASGADAVLGAYVQSVRSGTADEAGAAAVSAAELAGTPPEELRSAARAAARRHHERALASPDADEALARETVALALLARGCPRCVREQIPVLLHLAQLEQARADAGALARIAESARGLEPTGLDAAQLGDWPLLRQQSELCERIGDFATAARIEQALLAAKLQILAADHPQVAASRARIAELERRALEPPPVGAAPRDPAH
jgi:hypothetical protein